jgi:hypothetical protein
VWLSDFARPGSRHIVEREHITGLAWIDLSPLNGGQIFVADPEPAFCANAEGIIGGVFFLSFSQVLRPTIAVEACDEKTKRNTNSAVNRVAVWVCAGFSLQTSVCIQFIQHEPVQCQSVSCDTGVSNIHGGHVCGG